VCVLINNKPKIYRFSEMTKVSSKAMPQCSFCGKEIPSQGLKTHMKWCKLNQLRPKDSEDSASDDSVEPRKRGAPTINVSQTFHAD